MIPHYITRLLSVFCLLIFVSCGPETILLRPTLDSPSQHVDNGYKLMAYGKTDAAIREFKRSMELDGGYAPAYVGLGIVYGIQGELDQGRVMMEKAKTLARNEEQKKEVEMGFERLEYIEKEEAQ
jgi:tetratricopeptide (TPR) repeat protein